MIGLLYKNLYASKKETALMVIIAGAMVVFIALAGPSALLPCIGGVTGLSIVAPAASIQLDRQSGWNRFACASPIPRSKILLSFYLSALIRNAFFLCLLILGKAISRSAYSLWIFPVLLGIILLLQAITIPVGIKLGQTAVVIIFLFAVFGFTGLTALLGRLGILTGNIIDQIAAVFLAAPWRSSLLCSAGSAVLFALSYALTCRIYQRMEF